MNFSDVPMKFGYIQRDFIEVEWTLGSFNGIEWTLMTFQWSSMDLSDISMGFDEP